MVTVFTIVSLLFSFLGTTDAPPPPPQQYRKWSDTYKPLTERDYYREVRTAERLRFIIRRGGGTSFARHSPPKKLPYEHVKDALRDIDSANDGNFDIQHIFPMRSSPRDTYVYRDLHHIIASNAVTDKGQIARMMLYIEFRYNGDPNYTGSDGGNPKLILENSDFHTLVRLHCQHPASEREKERNEQVYLVQGDRNPFIDEPVHFFKLVYGTDTCDGDWERNHISQFTPKGRGGVGGGGGYHHNDRDNRRHHQDDNRGYAPHRHRGGGGRHHPYHPNHGGGGNGRQSHHRRRDKTLTEAEIEAAGKYIGYTTGKEMPTLYFEGGRLVQIYRDTRNVGWHPFRNGKKKVRGNMDIYDSDGELEETCLVEYAYNANESPELCDPDDNNAHMSRGPLKWDFGQLQKDEYGRDCYFNAEYAYERLRASSIARNVRR